jgi:mono/diheme cytochrome c family protein
MKALPVQELCVSCHGPADRLSPATKAGPARRYPDDEGTGYLPGQIRGAMTIRKPI